MKKLIALFLLFTALTGYCVDRHILQITITNLPLTGDNLSFSAPASKVLIWSNTTTATFVATNTTVNGCATNLFLQFAAYAGTWWTPRPALRWANTNSFYVDGECGAVTACTNSGTWATLVIDTNDCTKQLTVNVPISAEKFATSRVYIASEVVRGINSFTTNAFDGVRLTNMIAMNGTVHVFTNGWFTNSAIDKAWISNGVAMSQRITNGVGLNSVVWGLTNGFWTNGVLDKPLLTNGINYGNAFSSPGATGTASEQFGLSAIATNNAALAVGNSARAAATGATAIGQGALATNDQSSAFGVSAIAGGYRSIALGVEVSVLGYNSVGINATTDSTHTNSIGIGGNTTERNQIVLGSSSTIALVTAPGRIAAGSYTNNALTGTNQNFGDWADEEVSVSTLANGNNIAVSPTNVFMRLVAGPTAAFTINGIQNGRSGKQIWLWNDTGQQMTLAHESGVDPTPANRIYCTSGGDIVFGTNALAFLKYSAARSRWVAQINTNAITLANNSVTDGILRDSSALSVIGRAANSTGDPADIAAGANGLFLGRTNDTVGFVKVGLTNASMYNVNPVGQTNGQVLGWDGTSNIWTNQTKKETYALTLFAGISSLSPADSTTYYVGDNYSLAAQTTYSTAQTLVPFAGRVTKAIYVVIIGSTLGSTEDVTLSIRVNDTTDSATTAQDWDAAYRATASGDLDVAVAAGDTLVMKIVTPAWATNPVQVRCKATVMIERNP